MADKITQLFNPLASTEITVEMNFIIPALLCAILTDANAMRKYFNSLSRFIRGSFRHLGNEANLIKLYVLVHSEKILVISTGKNVTESRTSNSG